MRTAIKILIIILFAVSLFTGMAQETVRPGVFNDDYYPYWWERAEPGLHETWDRLEDMGVCGEHK